MPAWRHRLDQPRTWVIISLLAFSVIVIFWFSQALAPVLAACVIAYLLDGLVVRLEYLRVPRVVGTILVMLGLLVLLALVLFSLLPTMADQINSLANQLPAMVASIQRWVTELQLKFPQLENTTASEFLGRLSNQIETQMGRLIAILLAWAGGTIGNSVNAIIVVFLVFFILKDRRQIWEYLKHLTPLVAHPMVTKILADIDRQMGRFIKGKVIVVLLLFLLSTAVFAAIGLNYFLLLGIMTGLSTFIPYVGAIVVAVPVIATGFVQWGTWGGGVGATVAYLAVQAVDANYLTPVIIGRETSIHPVAIILAILICGTLWGFWGVFFAVPIAVVVKAVLDQVYFPAREGTLGELADEREATDDGEAG